MAPPGRSRAWILTAQGGSVASSLAPSFVRLAPFFRHNRLLVLWMQHAERQNAEMPPGRRARHSADISLARSKFVGFPAANGIARRQAFRRRVHIFRRERGAGLSFRRTFLYRGIHGSASRAARAIAV